LQTEGLHRDWVGYGASILLGVVAASPWLQGFSYSRGYDFFLWVYNAWYLHETFSIASLPNWSPYSACGQPFFKIAGLSDGMTLAALMEIFGVFGGVQAYVCGLYVAAAIGFYRLAYSLLGSRLPAWVATMAYVLSWFLTFTVYFQAYLSNMFAYAALPWFVVYARKAVGTREVLAIWASSLILALMVLANPQVAIKAGIIGAWLAWPLWHRERWRSWVGVWGAIGLLALAYSFFDVVSGLRLRDEVLTINSRRNSYISPFTLIAIPGFVFALLSEFVSGLRWPEMHLWELLYSEYPGLVVVGLAVLALIYARERLVVVLWWGVAASYALFFLVMPHILASPWLGTSHNLLVLPTFALSLLAGFGVLGLRKKLADGLAGHKQGRIPLYAIIALLFCEYYGLLLGLKVWGTSATAPVDLPEVTLWRQVATKMSAEESESRFFSFNPDWTIGLFPVVTGKPTANVIELRQRSPDYQAYLNLLSRCFRANECGPSPSMLLAPLNVGFVDLPLKYFTYVNPNAELASGDASVRTMSVFDRDGHLKRFASRLLAPEDQSHQAAATDWSPWGDPAAGSGESVELAQVVYENAYRLPVFVAPRTVALVGEGEARQEVFAQIVELAGYDPGRVLFLLVESLDELTPLQQAALSGFFPATGKSGQTTIPRVGLAELQGWYDESLHRAVPKIDEWRREGAERITIRLREPMRKDGFLFVSQQRFKDWKAHYGNGANTSVFKATAGLSAVFIEVERQEVYLQYELPEIERWSRRFSLLAFVGATVAAVALGRGKCLAEKAVEKNGQ